MRVHPLARLVLAAGMFLAAIPRGSTAPVPKATAAPLDKYLLDDTDFLIVVEVKKILASPLFAKQFRPLVEDFLKSEAAQAWLKDAGFDPLRDIDRVMVVADRSAHSSPESPAGPGPVLLVQGRFNKDKLKGKLTDLGANAFMAVHVEAQGDEVFKITIPHETPYYLTQLDRNTLILAGKKTQIAQAKEKANGKKKTVLKYQFLRDFLKQRKADQAVQIAAGANFVVTTEMISNGKQAFVLKQNTLGDIGVLGLLGGFSVGGKIKGGVTLKAPDADKAKDLAAKVQKGLDEMRRDLARAVQGMKELEPLTKVVDAISIKPNEATVHIAGVIEGESLRSVVTALWPSPTIRAGASSPPRPPLPSRKR